MRLITFQAVLETSTSPVCKVGERAVTPDGRIWRYGKANEAIPQYNIAVPVAVTTVLTVSSSTDGNGKILYITEASAGWTVGQFQGFYVHVHTGTGEGQIAKVKDNTADTLQLEPSTPLTTALNVADSGIKLWGDFVVRKAVVTSKIQNAVGASQVAFASGDYGFFLERGVGAVIAGEALTVGGSFVTGDDTAGQVVKGITAKGEFDEQTLGTCLTANTSVDKAALVRFAIN